MLKHDPWATVARVEMEERAERAARARLRREAREERAASSPSGSVIPHMLWPLIRLAGRAAPLPRV